MLNILLERKRVSARSLADELEVSERTVYRDAEALCAAGFPVYATTGRDGGFSLVDGFRLSGQLFSTGEIQRVLSALDGLSGVCPEAELARLRGKFSRLLDESTGKGVPCIGNRIFIEHTPSGRERAIIDLIDASISASSVLHITYLDAHGRESVRDIECHALVYQWQSWFVYSWCRLRSAFRCFRVGRICALRQTELARVSPPVDIAARPWRGEWEGDTFGYIAFTVDRSARGRLLEIFGPQEISERADGRILVRTRMPGGDWILSWLIGIGGGLSVIEPEDLRLRLCGAAREIAENNRDSMKH